MKAFLERFENDDLMFGLQLVDLLQDGVRIRRRDEAGNVDVHEGGHQELAVETIHDAAVAGYDVAEVFDFERSLKAGREETAERCDDRAERGEGQ